jgi:hypothetical protein
VDNTLYYVLGDQLGSASLTQSSGVPFSPSPYPPITLALPQLIRVVHLKQIHSLL